MALQLKPKVQNDGTKWFDFDAETKIELASIDNPFYQVALERVQRRINRNDARFAEGDVGVVDGEVAAHDNHCALLANYVVKGWKGVLDEDGNPLKFSADTAKQLLLANTQFFMFVVGKASEYAIELKGELEETMGKSSPASSGKGNGRAKQKSDQSSTES